MSEKKQKPVQKGKKQKKNKQLKKVEAKPKRRVGRPGVRRFGPRKVVKQPYTRQDLRNVNTTKSMSSTASIMSNCNPLISVEAKINMLSLQGVAAAAVCAAIRRGFADAATNPSYPYFAYIYLTNILYSYVTNSVPQGTSYPYWLALIGQSLTSKTVKRYGGKMSYKFKVEGSTDTENLSWKLSLGPQLYSRFLNFGVRTNEVVNNNFYLMDQPDSYTEAEGSKAWQALLQYLQSEDPLNKMHVMVSSTENTLTTDDVSAYAVVSTSPGGGNDTGGWYQNLFSELPPRSPIFSKFVHPTVGSVAVDVSRGNTNIRAFAGDGFSLSGMLIDIIGDKQIHMKNPPIFKAVDFIEILEVYLLWLKTAVQAGCDATSATLTGNWDPKLLEDKFQIPLTIQEIALILRAECMNAFKDTQYFVQSAYPQTVSNQNQNAFVPFVAGAGCGSRPGATTALLPLLLKENLLSLTWVSNSQGRGAVANPMVYIPVLGKYYADTISESDYIITINSDLLDTPYTFSLFKSSEDAMFAPAKSKLSDLKAPMVKSNSKANVKVNTNPLTVETPINLIDGAVGDGYVAIAYPGSLSGLIEILNKYIKTKISDFSMPVCTLSSDGGINSLRSIAMTRFWAPTEESVSSRIRDPRFVKEALVGTRSPYENRSIRLVSAKDQIFQSVWESILEFWIMPTCLIQDDSNDIGKSLYPNRIQAITLEQYSITYDSKESTTAGSTLLSNHMKYATRMVKTEHAAESDIDTFLKECENSGRGGLLSSLAGSALGALFPSAKGVIDAVSQIVPI